ncbi:winged helix-turn-helix domain-containing protein [Thaumasiovibrio sp. DFM-14]|uniref:winged helix-turn-helix domain-containing protein n=1 Tax=Thaumasiovibrio sp. DFM-14 TaxID=3384792 RepID=UPI0039A29E77
MPKHYLLNNQFLFNQQNGYLHRRGDKNGHQLRSNEWKLLNLFLDNPGKSITIDQILSHVWLQARAKSNVLTTVKKLRQALNDNPDQPDYIQTQVMKGYAFIATIQVLTEKEYQRYLSPRRVIQSQLQQWIATYYRPIFFTLVSLISLLSILKSLIFIHDKDVFSALFATTEIILPVPVIIPKGDNASIEQCLELVHDAEQYSLFDILPASAEVNTLTAPGLRWTSDKREVIECVF